MVNTTPAGPTEERENLSEETIELILDLVKTKIRQVLARNNGLQLSTSLQEPSIELQESPDGEKDEAIILETIKTALRAIFKTNNLKFTINDSVIKITAADSENTKTSQPEVVRPTPHLETSKRTLDAKARITLPPSLISKIPDSMFIYYKFEGTTIKCIVSPIEIALPGYNVFNQKTSIDHLKGVPQKRISLSKLFADRRSRIERTSKVIGMIYSPENGYIILGQHGLGSPIFTTHADYQEEISILEAAFENARQAD
jgi:hypothetical protein